MQPEDNHEYAVTDSAIVTSSTVYNVAIVPGQITHEGTDLHIAAILQAEAHLASEPFDIEHVFVKDDPRQWSRRRKAFTLAIVASASLIATLGINIYNPAIRDIKTQLHATDQEISLTLSVFILVQGSSPLLWSAVSEIRGRKFVYIASITFYVVGCGIAGSARTTGVLIAMRVMQAVGGSAVLTIGAATLADIYDPRERGTVVGIYYAAPLLGPSLGPIIGGVLSQFLTWRATFYFLSIFSGLSLLTFIFFRDTFRRERSLSYQAVLRRRMTENQVCAAAKVDANENGASVASAIDPESVPPPPTLVAMPLGLRDINPIGPVVAVIRQRCNIAVLFPSALLFGFSYCITYTAALTFATAPYNYGALDIGLVLLSFGIGGMAGSIIGGRWSDHVLAQMKTKNSGRTSPEDRLHSTKPMMFVLPLSLIAYAWSAEKKIHVAVICISLLIVGFSSVWMYSSTLAYIVDANTGCSSTAVAANSFVRGFAGFVAAELAVPFRNVMGDGGLYTLWAGLMTLSAGVLLLTIVRGAQWREAGERSEKMEKTGNREKTERQ